MMVLCCCQGFIRSAQGAGVCFFQRYNSSKSLFKNSFVIRNLGAFLAQSAKNRAFRDFAIATAPARSAGAASHPSNPLRTHSGYQVPGTFLRFTE
jgi:hypothetical protein